MGLILWIIFGALAGWIASMIMKTNAKQGTLANIIIGVIGASIGGFLMSGIGESGVGGFTLYSFFVAVLGACLFIAIIRALRGV